MIPHTPTRAFSPQPSVIHGSQYQSVSIRQGSQSTHLARTSTSESSVFGGHENDSFPHCHPKQQMNSTSICEQIRATRIPCSASRDLLAHTPSLCKDDNYNNRVINTDVKQNILSAAAVQKRVIMYRVTVINVSRKWIEWAASLCTAYSPFSGHVYCRHPVVSYSLYDYASIPQYVSLRRSVPASCCSCYKFARRTYNVCAC